MYFLKYSNLMSGTPMYTKISSTYCSISSFFDDLVGLCNTHCFQHKKTSSTI